MSGLGNEDIFYLHFQVPACHIIFPQNSCCCCCFSQPPPINPS